MTHKYYTKYTINNNHTNNIKKNIFENQATIVYNTDNIYYKLQVITYKFSSMCP